MKWIYGIKNKLWASGMFLVLCLLVFASHYRDRSHTEKVNNSLVTMYEDRLIAEDYLLKMTSILYQIRETARSEANWSSKSVTMNALLDDFNRWYTIYSKTQLTIKEQATTIELINYIKTLEQNVLNINYDPSFYTDKALTLLNELSIVQVEESKLLIENSKSEYASMKAYSKFTFAIIIIILLIVQAMVFSSDALIPAYKVKDPRYN
ncbi:MAG TPA: hypothetical protein PLL09_13435 [Flavobacterium sp.]|uniref:hypothetical protein n=1 Tax=unclassified Flavobacterium TaxID=196869 RepID=UPI000E838B3A|nr:MULTISPECIES: hypothetical protein [unclassified Flavobacterium]HBI01120.1 hypothetical protein [Flavobacterium sp.]HRE78814.1 hypothetical protein [Flavobacterium sp.]